jgi:hypothetical protein
VPLQAVSVPRLETPERSTPPDRFGSDGREVVVQGACFGIALARARRSDNRCGRERLRVGEEPLIATRIRRTVRSRNAASTDEDS